MKVCPSCRKTYPDDNLNFCLEDGSVLTQASAAPPAAADTVLVNQTRMPPRSGQPGAQPGGGGAPQQFSMQPPAKKGSKTWVWIVGILALLVLVCGGGMVGFFAWVASLDTNTNTYRANTDSRTPGGTTSPTTPGTKTKFEDVEEIDLSNAAQKFSIYGDTEFTDGEFLAKCNSMYAYYVLLAAERYSSDSALTTITVRNVDDSPTERGFGLVFHSDPSVLNQDYAFLIDSKKKRYRVIRHDKQKELVVVKWTNFAGIKDGTEKNVLEVRDEGDDLLLFVNGQQVTKLPDTYGYKNGSPGMYTSGAVRAAFSDFQVKK
jgi:hypothetical protein